jgi:hypothetical protein
VVPLLREFFLHRADHVAVLMERGRHSYPQPIRVEGEHHLEALLSGHVIGDDAAPVHVFYEHPNGTCGAASARFRVGAYPIDPITHCTRWLCIDIDAHGGDQDVADPIDTAQRIVAAFQREDMPAYLERSGGGHGWHVWVFFTEPVLAATVRRVAWEILPKDILLVNGAPANPRRNVGIEVFPKQNRIAPGGFGNLVWLPWWAKARNGGAQFYSHDDLAPYTPQTFDTVDVEVIDEYFATLPELHFPAQPLPAAEYAFDGTAEYNEKWHVWKHNALVALPLDEVYGEWLTGRELSNGWVQCRDPASPTGDRNPSAAVATGAGEHPRGHFTSYRDGRTLSIFDFMVENGMATNYSDALLKVSSLTRLPLPAFPDFVGELEMDVVPVINPYTGELEMRPIDVNQRPEPSSSHPLGVTADIATWFTTPAPALQFLFEGIVERGTMTGVFAQGGLGKGWFTEILAISAATGVTLLPSFRPVEAWRVLWIEDEDSEAELHRRAERIARYYNDKLTGDVLALCSENLVVHCGKAFNFANTLGELVRPTEGPYAALCEEIRTLRPHLVIIDPLSSFIAADENSNTQMRQVIGLFRDLCSLFAGGPTVWLNHHTSKERETDIASAAGRGASAIRDAMRSCFSMVPLSERDVTRLGVMAPHLYVKLGHTKANHTAMMGDPIFLERQTGDCGGVLREVTRGELGGDKLERIAYAILHWMKANDCTVTREQMRVMKQDEAPFKLLREEGVSCSKIDRQNALDLGVELGILRTFEEARGKRMCVAFGPAEETE